MDRQPILLSISIPTYNRALSFEKTLASVASQVAKDDPRIEIVVSDNCSTDDTEAIARLHAAEHPAIRYFRNTYNNRFDRNCDSVVQRSRGEFVWILADDDYVESDAVARVLEAITANPDVSFIFLNYALYKDDFQTFVSSSRVRPEAAGFAADGNEFYLRCQFGNTFVSSNVFRRTAWMGARPEQYYDTGWIHVFVARDILLTTTAYVVGRQILRQGSDEARLDRRSPEAYDVYMHVYFEFAKYVHEMPARGYSHAVFELGRSIVRSERLRQVVFMKTSLDGYHLPYLLKIFAGMWRYHRWSLIYWMVDVPVLFAPGAVVRALYRMAKPTYVKLRTIRQLG